MRLLVFGFMALVLAPGPGSSAPAPPPPAPPITFLGRDHVLIGRVYWREGGQTQPIARFGMILDGKPVTHVVQVPAQDSPVGDVGLMITARRESERAARVGWSLRPGAGARMPAAEGKADVQEGSIGHVALGVAGGGELFASLETGRASTFHLDRLWQHFGVMTDAQRLATAASPSRGASAGWTQGPMAAPGAAAAPPATPVRAGGSMTLSCPSGSAFDLATGSATGRCDVTVEGDRIAGGACDDGAGNAARASCTVNEGQGSCLATTGSGTCRKRS